MAQPRRVPNVVIVGLMCLGLLASFGPHIGMLALRTAGIRVPAALAYFCVLDHSHSTAHKPATSTSWSLPGVPPLRDHG
jgi:hypothetical protein